MLLDQELQQDAAVTAAWKKLEETKGLTERLTAVVHFPWYYARLQFTGEGTRKQAFELFDDILCGLLLTREGQSGLEMRDLLGLNDDLGEKAFEVFMKPLQGTMIQGDESYYSLSDQGRIYAKAGSKYKSYKETFGIVVDMYDSRNLQAKEVHAHVGKPIPLGPQSAINIAGMEASLRKYFEQLKTLLPYVQVQEPKMHLPEKGFYLDQATIEKVAFEQCNLWIGVLEEVGTDALTYQALLQDGLKPVPSISAFLSNSPQKDVHAHIAKAVAAQYPAEIVEAPKTATQLEDERWLQAKVKALDPLPEAEKLAAQATLLDERKTFSTHAFEAEIEHLSQTCKGELWMVSPWIRFAAFEKRRVQIERLLKNGATVLLGYSSPHQAEDEMVAPAVRTRLQAMQSTYPRLFVAELPQFHEKMMFVDHGNGKRFEYTGSFNILSFAVGSQEKIGRENMRRSQWDRDSQHNYDYQREAFICYYQVAATNAFAAIPHVIPLDRPEITKVEKALGECERKYASFFQYAGGQPQADFVQQVADSRNQIVLAKRAWMVGKISEESQRLTPMSSLAPATAKEEMKRMLDRLRELALPEADVQAELAAFRILCDTKAMLFDLDTFSQKLNGHKPELIASEKSNYEKEIVRIPAAYPHAQPEVVAGKLALAQDLLRQKSATMGLKIVGKVDLPPSKNQSKKKNKKR